MHIILALDVSFGSLISLKLYIILVICFALNRTFVKFDLSLLPLYSFFRLFSLYFLLSQVKLGRWPEKRELGLLAAPCICIPMAHAKVNKSLLTSASTLIFNLIFRVMERLVLKSMNVSMVHMIGMDAKKTTLKSLL